VGPRHRKSPDQRFALKRTCGWAWRDARAGTLGSFVHEAGAAGTPETSGAMFAHVGIRAVLISLGRKHITSTTCRSSFRVYARAAAFSGGPGRHCCLSRTAHVLLEGAVCFRRRVHLAPSYVGRQRMELEDFVLRDGHEIPGKNQEICELS